MIPQTAPKSALFRILHARGSMSVASILKISPWLRAVERVDFPGGGIRVAVTEEDRMYLGTDLMLHLLPSLPRFPRGSRLPLSEWCIRLAKQTLCSCKFHPCVNLPPRRHIRREAPTARSCSQLYLGYAEVRRKCPPNGSNPRSRSWRLCISLTSVRTVWPPSSDSKWHGHNSRRNVTAAGLLWLLQCGWKLCIPNCGVLTW